LFRKSPKSRSFRAIFDKRSSSVLLVTVLLLASGGLGYLILERGYPGAVPPPPMALASVAPAPSVLSAPALREIVGSFNARQTVTQALELQGVARNVIHELIESTRPVYNLAKVAAGRPYWVGFAPGGELHEFRYPVDDERYLTVYRDSEGFVPVMKNFPYTTKVEAVSGYIDGSLFIAVTEAGEQEILAMELANIFTYDVDFYTDIQKGDSFRMLVEKKYLDGKFAKYGSIIAASISNQGKTFSGFRFENEAGKPEYYDGKGNSLKKSFLKSPLKFARITSRFTTARYHPILKIVRPHLGVDYAAPSGTPVVAVASGTVATAGWSGQGGNAVRLRHFGGTESMYMHLSRILVRSGAHVEQGDVVGLVGMTGLATGPHLDFRLLQRGKFINPAKAIFPPSPPVSQPRFARFTGVRDSLQKQLQDIVF
jgi:murein DD-endopeptidase MepM/ murein hydrolase activator NlpD